MTPSPADVRAWHEREAASFEYSASLEEGWTQEQRQVFGGRARLHRDAASAIRELEQENERLRAELADALSVLRMAGSTVWPGTYAMSKAVVDAKCNAIRRALADSHSGPSARQGET